MAIINSYPLATPKLTDLVLGTSTSSTGQTSTKSFTVQSIKDTTAGVQTIITTVPATLNITGSGTANVTINAVTAAVTDGSAALTTGNDVYDFVVGKITGTANTVPIWTTTTTLGDSLISQAANGVIINGNSSAQIDGKLTLNCWNGNHGVTIQAPSHSAQATYTLILPTVSNPGAGKVLTSGAGTTNQLSWTDNGNVGGTGTQNKLSKWSDATTLADSNVEDTGTLVTISSAAKVTGNLELDADLLDVNGSTGTAGQLLSSLGPGAGVDWIPAPATGVASLSTTNTNLITITSPGTTPHTGAVVATPNISGGVSSSSNTLATGTQIQAAIDLALAGAVTFKGTFNASTGAITSGGNLTSGGSRVAVAVGDMYVVSVGGNFYGNASTPLNVGDEVIAVSAAAAGASVEGDWNAVPSAGGGVTDVASGNAAIAVSPSTGSVVVTSTAYSGGANIGHVPTGGSAGKYLDGASGAWTTLPAGDTYDLNATTDGSNVDINLTSGSGTDNSTVQLTAGTGMTITQSGGNNITLEAASGGGTKTVATVASVAAGVSTHALGVSVTTTPLVNYVDLYISGVYQSKTSYTVSGSTLTLTGATFPTGALIESVTTT
tara:strand:- start:228 stop:2048 length:1821 start_codon:yes stop_codon:yes gene_type:complete